MNQHGARETRVEYKNYASLLSRTQTEYLTRLHPVSESSLRIGLIVMNLKEIMHSGSKV